MIKRVSKLLSGSKKRILGVYTTIKQDIQKRPIANFYLALAAFVLLIGLSNFLRTPPATVQSETIEPKTVSVYSIGSVPKMTVQAQIEKSGVITIVALSNGVVQKVHFHEGEETARGSTLISLSSNYQGGNTFSAQRLLAQTQYQSATDTFDLQKNLIQDQRNVATVSAENAQKMRDIAGQSREDTRNLVTLNETMLQSVNNSLSQLENNPQADPAMIASLQGQKAQLLGALAQARSGLASADYQSDANRPPAELARLQKDLTLKQLELQEKMLGVNKEVARLQLQLAQVTEGLMFPSTPVTGIVQRVYVKEGDVVAPGAPLAIVAQAAEEDPITAVAYVPQSVAAKVSFIEPSILKIDSQTYEVYPSFVSTEAVQGNSYAVYFSVPDSFSGSLTEDGFIDVDIPVGYADTTASAVFIPIDAVYQTSERAYVFVIKANKAESREVRLGKVYGKYVEVASGLGDGDQVIVTRNVIDGDPVDISNIK